MADRDDLSKLTRASRGRPKVRRLVCPLCRGPVELRDFRLHCLKSEREGLPAPSFASLAELALAPEGTL